MSTEITYVEKLETKVDNLEEEVSDLENQLEYEEKRASSLENELEELKDQLEDYNMDDPEDCRRSLFFALTELEEVERGEVSLNDKLFDLRMRHCRFL